VPTGLTVLGLCRVGFLAVFIWSRFYPPAFTVDVRSTHVEYEFRDGSLAREFAERIELIGDLWDSLAENPESVVLTGAQEAELDRRLEAYRKDPAQGSPRPVVHDRIARRP